ncbi:hypothetical protein CsSME_00023621 [Camellia sinensis var. sinensis]
MGYFSTMGELKKLVEKASPNTIWRAHAVHPITALQMEYSLLTRDIEEEIIPLCNTREFHQEYINTKGQEFSS